MKKKYFEPEFEVCKFVLTAQLLLSIPEPTIPEETVDEDVDGDD